MSLFKARDWWCTRVGDNEVFDLGCFAVGNVDNAISKTDKIVVGSFHGMLRVYKPQQGENGNTFNPLDLLCEMQLSEPVLQVEIGRFISGSDKLHIAVLHSRKLALYSLSVISGQVEHGVQYQLKLVHEHQLQRTAFNMCFGAFGGVKGKDFVCVQSMDGALSIYEQESFAFTRFLPEALLPGPICYVAKTDSFITVSSSRVVESYKYQVLAVASDVKTKEESQNVKTGKKVVTDWQYNIGESAIDIQVANFATAPLCIYILGERNMYVLTETGKLRYMKKFDFNPSCFYPYGSVSENTINCLVGTHTNTLMVYKDATLKWAAQLGKVPVQVNVANFLELHGAMVTLNEDGLLSCTYMGTDPAMFYTPTAEVRDIDYTQLNEEMTKLQAEIKLHQRTDAIDLPTEKTKDEIVITFGLPSELDAISRATQVEFKDDEPIPSITATVFVKALFRVSDVRITMHVPAPLYGTDTLMTYKTLDASRPVEWDVSFYKRSGGLISSLNVKITAMYKSCSGSSRIIHSMLRLPLKLVCAPVMPAKSATFKVTMDTNKPPVSLNDIFSDMLGDSLGGSGNALGFRVYGTQHEVTVLASKTSKRYRLQCDAFENLWLIMDETAKRLIGHMMAHGNRDFKLSYDSQLPLQEFFDVIDTHFNCRLKEASVKQKLEERSGQFRAVQRRLLTRFKDKTPVPLANLDTLLNGTYTQLMQLAEEMEANKEMQTMCANNLTCATRIVIFLVRIWLDMSDTEFSVLESTVTPFVDGNDQQGWEEMVDAAITHLLRTCLAKSAKDQTINPNPLVLLKDTQKLKKHIALLCDRLGKGAKLVLEKHPDAPSVDNDPISVSGGVSREEKKTSVTGSGIAPNVNDFAPRRGIHPDKKFGPSNSSAGSKPSMLPMMPLMAMSTVIDGSRFMKKDSGDRISAIREVVPDLDDISTEEGDINSSTGELVYGMNDDEMP